MCFLSCYLYLYYITGPVNQVMNWNTQGYTNNAEESGKSSTYQKLKFKK